jgi:hypothetical protein
MTVIAYTETLMSLKNTYFHKFYVNEYFGMLNNVCLREWINEYFALLCSLLSEHQDKWHIVASGLECSISTFMWKWDNTLFLFATLCCTAITYFHSFALPPGVRFQNVFCSKSCLKCSWFPNFKPSFLKIGIGGHNYIPVLRWWHVVWSDLSLFWWGWEISNFCVRWA